MAISAAGCRNEYSELFAGMRTGASGHNPMLTYMNRRVWLDVRRPPQRRRGPISALTNSHGDFEKIFRLPKNDGKSIAISQTDHEGSRVSVARILDLGTGKELAK